MDDATFMFSVPPHAQLATKSIVVATCAAAALLMGGPHGEGLTFTHVLIDEAGQALLPEALLPVTLLRPPLGGVLDPGWGAVVCGDPKQLGPVVRSPVAAAAGLSCSLLEHLVSAHSAASTVALGAGRAPATSMLLRNYRSHSTLLDLPSKMFYQGALLAAADQASVLPPQWSELSRAEQPATPEGLSPRAELDSEEGKVEESENSGEVTDPSQLSASLLFYGVRGEQVRDADAPSYCNPLEASTVAELVEGLLESGAGVTKGDIGVMATYRKQVQLIRTMLRHKGLAAVRVSQRCPFRTQHQYKFR